MSVENYERYLRYHLNLLFSVPGYVDRLKATGGRYANLPLVLYLTYSGPCLSPLPTFQKDVKNSQVCEDSVIMHITEQYQYNLLMSGALPDIVDMIMCELGL